MFLVAFAMQSYQKGIAKLWKKYIGNYLSVHKFQQPVSSTTNINSLIDLSYLFSAWTVPFLWQTFGTSSYTCKMVKRTGLTQKNTHLKNNYHTFFKSSGYSSFVFIPLMTNTHKKCMNCFGYHDHNTDGSFLVPVYCPHPQPPIREKDLHFVQNILHCKL